MRQACAALAQAHAKGIVHRDIKPENLFVAEGPTGAPCLKVLDFGISKQARLLAADSAITGPAQNMGSPFYMSPEQDDLIRRPIDSRTEHLVAGRRAVRAHHWPTPVFR